MFVYSRSTSTPGSVRSSTIDPSPSGNRTHVTAASEKGIPPTHVFSPLHTRSPFSSVTSVVIDPTSDPASGSEIAMETCPSPDVTSGRYCSLTVSEPNRSMARGATMLCM